MNFPIRIAIIYSILQVLFTCIAVAQSPEIKKLVVLDEILTETSGLAYIDGMLLSHNDSGGEPCLYAIDISNGSVSDTLCFNNLHNTDWEDLSSDENYLYIGDIGNNSGTRNPLKIFRIKREDIYNPDAKVDSICFRFDDQNEYTSMFRKTDYDCESLFSSGDRLFVFTKDWNNKKTKMYSMPNTPGVYSVKPMVELDVNALITGAAFNNEIKVLALIAYEKAFPFHPLLILIHFDDEFNQIVNYTRITLKINNMQTEGIAWTNNKTLFITNEKFLKVKAQLMTSDLTNCGLLSFLADSTPDPENLMETGYNFSLILIDKNANTLFEGKLKKFLRMQDSWINVEKPARIEWHAKKANGWFLWQ